MRGLPIIAVILLLSLPAVSAHNMPFLSFRPTVVSPGQNVTISGDGLKVSGNYSIYLIGTTKSILLGYGHVDDGEDSFDATLPIPGSLPGNMYTVEMVAPNNSLNFTAPLQLSIQPYSVNEPGSLSYSQYPIPANELPWILVLIALCAYTGVFLVTRRQGKHNKKQ